MSTTNDSVKRNTVDLFRKKKEAGIPISMLTAYDYPLSQMMDQAGVDSILVGDSLAMVGLGYDDTLSVTMEEMLHHCRVVARGSKQAFLIGDMPFMSYQVSKKEAVRNAGRFLKDGRMNAVKVEGGKPRVKMIKAIIESGIPVLGHLGLTPQSINVFGGFKAQGKTWNAAVQIARDAKLLEEAGCFAIVLESVPEKLASHITAQLSIPTIGIGAGNQCDGQVLVTQDMLGMFQRFTPKFAKKYVNLSQIITDAIGNYIKDVTERDFPSKEHCFEIKDEQWEKFLDEVDD